MTRHPSALATCAAMEPVAPAAEDTSTVSPGWARPISRKPAIAAMPTWE